MVYCVLPCDILTQGLNRALEGELSCQCKIELQKIGCGRCNGPVQYSVVRERIADSATEVSYRCLKSVYSIAF